MGALNPTEVTVKIGASGTAGSSASLTTFTTRLTNFKQSGGDRPQESVPVFGNANVTKYTPRNEFEVSFDAILQYSDSMLFDQLVMSSVLDGSTGVTSDVNPSTKVIYLQWYDGSSYHSRGYNNVTATMWEPELSADEYVKGTIKFQLSPTTPSANANVKVYALALTNSVFSSWGA